MGKAAATPRQLGLFCPDLPAELLYRANLVSPGELDGIQTSLKGLDYAPFDFQGHLAHRQVASFGWRYDYGQRRLLPCAPIPGFILSVREMLGSLPCPPPSQFEQVLVNYYAPGAGIGWHRDKAQYGVIAGVSLGAPAELRFRRQISPGRWERRRLRLEPGSVYVLDGEARSLWEHSISPQTEERFSITFRTLAPR